MRPPFFVIDRYRQTVEPPLPHPFRRPAGVMDGGSLRLCPVSLFPLYHILIVSVFRAI